MFFIFYLAMDISNIERIMEIEKNAESIIQKAEKNARMLANKGMLSSSRNDTQKNVVIGNYIENAANDPAQLNKIQNRVRELRKAVSKYKDKGNNELITVGSGKNKYTMTKMDALIALNNAMFASEGLLELR